MKTKQDLEKMFDEKDFRFDDSLSEIDLNQVKQFIFETIIPEVLNNILERPFSDESNMMYKEGYSECIEQIKQKAKELYNINL